MATTPNILLGSIETFEQALGYILPPNSRALMQFLRTEPTSLIHTTLLTRGQTEFQQLEGLARDKVRTSITDIITVGVPSRRRKRAVEYTVTAQEPAHTIDNHEVQVRILSARVDARLADLAKEYSLLYAIECFLTYIIGAMSEIKTDSTLPSTTSHTCLNALYDISNVILKGVSEQAGNKEGAKLLDVRNQVVQFGDQGFSETASNLSALLETYLRNSQTEFQHIATFAPEKPRSKEDITRIGAAFQKLRQAFYKDAPPRVDVAPPQSQIAQARMEELVRSIHTIRAALIENPTKPAAEYLLALMRSIPAPQIQ